MRKRMATMRAQRLCEGSAVLSLMAMHTLDTPDTTPAGRAPLSHPAVSHPPSPPGRLLVVGAQGGLGAAVSGAFVAAGWQVRALARRLPAGTPSMPVSNSLDDTKGQDWAHPGLHWWQGDAMDAAGVLRAARGASCVVHAVNPPNYQHWRQWGLPMLTNSMQAAQSVGARLLFPGNVYNFGPDAGALVDEHSPQHPLTRKGQVRVEMEAMLAQAAEQGLRALVVRAGDFFGGEGHSSWFNNFMVKAGRRPRRVWFPGQAQVGHSWVYLPDLAQVFVQLMAHAEDFGAMETFHVEGHWLADNWQMVEALREALGAPDLPVHRLPWLAMHMLQGFAPVLREVLEMKYLWQHPLRLDNRKLLGVLGREPRTPLVVALRQSLQSMSCLSPAPRLVDAEGLRR